ncbi:MAG: TlpA disulfide reductase family protein [Planctomycetota bacterium]
MHLIQVLLLGVTLALLRQLAPQATDPAEAEWTRLRDRISARLAELEAKGQKPTVEMLSRDLDEVDRLVRRHRLSRPDVAVAALFFKASLLDDRLDEDDLALEAYDAIIRWKELDFYFVAEAFVSKAAILRKRWQDRELEALIEAYAAREDADPQVRSYLEGSLRHARLKPGAPYPPFKAALLSGKEISFTGKEGKITVVLFMAAVKPRSLDQLELLEIMSQSRRGSPLAVVAVSLDQDRDRLKEELEKRQTTVPVVYDGRGWESPLAVTCGIQSVPSTYVIGRDGKILHVDVFGASLQALTTEALQRAEPEVRDGPEKGGD